ncbi:unnamed protein product [Pieris brassicae]|uniref:Uncharacterized protein n=1 Tax=Pieris brassicae TaxID=7116 RepID=A0A9P0TK36_PIEBR|nr:unnamed protein product [Pieris brassicae]
MVNSRLTATVPITPRARPVSARSADIVERVHVSVQRNRQQSTRKGSQSLDIKRTTLRRIMKRDLHLKAYKIQVVQELKSDDANNRLNFVKLEHFNNFNNVMRTIFTLMAIFARTSRQYLEDVVSTGWVHMSCGKGSIELLKDVFPGKLISKREEGHHSPDLSPCDYFLWAYLKSIVYETNLTNLEQLKRSIIRERRHSSIRYKHFDEDPTLCYHNNTSTPHSIIREDREENGKFQSSPDSSRKSDVKDPLESFQLNPHVLRTVFTSTALETRESPKSPDY